MCECLPPHPHACVAVPCSPHPCPYPCVVQCMMAPVMQQLQQHEEWECLTDALVVGRAWRIHCAHLCPHLRLIDFAKLCAMCVCMGCVWVVLFASLSWVCVSVCVFAHARADAGRRATTTSRRRGLRQRAHTVAAAADLSAGALGHNRGRPLQRECTSILVMPCSTLYSVACLHYPPPPSPPLCARS